MVQLNRLHLELNNTHKAQEEHRKKEDEHYIEANNKISDLLEDVEGIGWDHEGHDRVFRGRTLVGEVGAS